jgi:hypothetical protein
MNLRAKIIEMGTALGAFDADGYPVDGQALGKNVFLDPSEETVAEVEEAFRYLTRCERTRGFNRAVTTGSLKDYANEFSRFEGKGVRVRNGCLIVAAFIAGFFVKRTSSETSCALLNIGFHARPPGHWQPIFPPRRLGRKTHWGRA